MPVLLQSELPAPWHKETVMPKARLLLRPLPKKRSRQNAGPELPAGGPELARRLAIDKAQAAGL